MTGGDKGPPANGLFKHLAKNARQLLGGWVALGYQPLMSSEPMLLTLHHPAPLTNKNGLSCASFFCKLTNVLLFEKYLFHFF